MTYRFKLDGPLKVVSQRDDVSLELLEGVFPVSERTDAYLLTWHGRQIAFETPREGFGNDRNLEVLRLKMRMFGVPSVTTHARKLDPVAFADGDEREKAALDAVEALLTLSNSHYKREQTGYCVVEWGDRIYRLEDFGMVWAELGVDRPT